MTPNRFIIILPDLHIRKARGGVPSGEDSQILRNVVFPFMREHKKRITHVIQLGDFLDLPSLSRHESWRETDEAVDLALGDYAYGREWTKELYEEAPDAKWIILEGNHDWRAKSFCGSRRLRHLLPVLDVPTNLRLTDYANLTWVPYWSDKRKLYTVGKASFGHGLSIARNHSQVMARSYPGTNIYYGHCHDHQSYAPATNLKHSLNEARSLGLLGRLEQPYMAGAPTNWCNMIGVMTMFPNGHYALENPIILGGRMVFGGKVYESNPVKKKLSI